MMTTVLDPVCGMTVDPARAAGQVEHQGQRYYFCSKGCAAKFAADPERYLARLRSLDEPASYGVASPSPQPLATSHQPPAKYTCPMHPEILSDRPGACPKRGMA